VAIEDLEEEAVILEVAQEVIIEIPVIIKVAVAAHIIVAQIKIILQE
jgi:hypothetical protein